MSVTGDVSQITEALLQRLGALTLSPAIPVAYPNVTFPAASSQAKPDIYLEARLMRAGSQPVGISEWNELPGILQVDVVYKSQDGELKPLQIADAVAAWFAKGTRLVNGSVQVDVYERPSIASAISDAPYMRIPVSVRYRSFVQ